MLIVCFKYSWRKTAAAAATEMDGDEWSMTYASPGTTRLTSSQVKSDETMRHWLPLTRPAIEAIHWVSEEE